MARSSARQFIKPALTFWPDRALSCAFPELFLPAERVARPIGRAMSLILEGTGLFIVFFFPLISPLLTAAGAAARSLFVG